MLKRLVGFNSLTSKAGCIISKNDCNMDPKPGERNKPFESNTNLILQCALNTLKILLMTMHGPLTLTSLEDLISSHLLYSDLCTDHTDLR